MEGSSEPTPAETPLADAPVEGKKTGWMKFAIISAIAGVICWVIGGGLLVAAMFIPFTGCCGGPICGLGWLAMVLAAVFLILGIMKV